MRMVAGILCLALSTAILTCGGVPSGWYKDKKLTKPAKKVKGTKSAKSRTLYAKWRRIAGKPYYVRAFNDHKKGGTSADVARVNDAMKPLKKKWLKRFVEGGYTIRVCNHAYFNRFIDRVHDAAGYFGEVVSADGWGDAIGGVVIRSESGTNPRLVCHEFGHWYEEQYVSKKNVKKLTKLHKRYVNQIRSILGSHAAESQGEGFAELFSAIVNHSLTAAQQRQLGSFYSLTRSLIK